MDLVGTIWDAAKCFCNCTAKHAAFVSHLEENLKSLEDNWTQLDSRREDVMHMIQQAESRPHMRKTQQVDDWLQRVNKLEKTVTEIREQGDKVVRDKCLGKFCHKNCVSSYNLGKDVVKTLDRVQELMGQGENFNNSNISYDLPREPEEMPVPETKGMDLMVEKVWNIIEADHVGIIGLCGMGGVGKTTLITKVYNEFVARKQDFPLVIWVVVSQNYNVDKIIDDICKSVGIDGKGKSRPDKVKEIYNVMKDKKFVLLLDDMWEALDLDRIGIPLPNETNHSKVLFATRKESVCHQMHAKMFKVECLKEEEAFDLFCMKVGEEIVNSASILELARELVKECKGLPLALVTLGRAMAGRENPNSWEHAIKLLKSSPSKDKGMEKEVFFVLKYSYDSLPSDMERKCFLYLGLFPEDESILIHDLILLWIGEGLLGDHDSIHDAFNHGHHLVETLKFACLVEDHGEDSIKVHDMIRDMALWLLHDQDGNKNKILVQGEALKLLHGHDNLENWKIVEKISIMNFRVHGTEISMLNIPICPHLKTLILKGLKINKLENIQFMSQLKVLRLREVEGIITIPSEIGQLIHLEYFELSGCSITEKLPIDIKNLKMLKVFILDGHGLALQDIPLEAISCLERLRVFQFMLMKLNKDISSAKELLLLKQLESLPHLEDISIWLWTPPATQKLLSSTKLQRCVRRVITYVPLSVDAKIIPSVTKLERLEFVRFFRLNVCWEKSLGNHFDIFSKLSFVGLYACHLLTHLTWLIYAPLLRFLQVQECRLLEEVIMENRDNGNQNMDGIFVNLEWIYLDSLPNLRSIYKMALPFPKLKDILVIECPELKELPLDSNSATYLEKIRGSSAWWDNLKWEDPTVRDSFRPKAELNW